MHRIDTATATAGNLFTEGDPVAGTPPTVVSDDWHNSIQEELAGYIESRGLVLVKADNTQLLQAIGGHIRSEATGNFRNFAINGRFRFWQRVAVNTAGPFSLPTTDLDVSDIGIVDRFYCTAGGGGVATIDRGDFTIGQTDVPLEPEHFLEFAQTTGATTSDPAVIQPVEDVRRLGGQTVTVSFYARTTASTVDFTVDSRQYFGAGGSTAVVQASSTGTLQANTTWTRFQFVIALGSMSGKTITQHDYTAFRLRLPQSQTFTLQIADFQVERDSGASAFEVRTYAEELRLCQRYCEKNASDPTNVDIEVDNASASKQPFMANYDGTGDNSFAPVHLTFATPKRTIGTGSGGAFFTFYRNGAADSIDTLAGAAGGVDGIDGITIADRQVMGGVWTSAVPAAAGVQLCQAAWLCDVEFGQE